MRNHKELYKSTKNIHDERNKLLNIHRDGTVKEGALGDVMMFKIF